MSSIAEPSLLLNRRHALIAASALAVSAGLPLGPAQANEPTTLDLTKGVPSMGYITTDDNVQVFYKDWGPRDAQPIVFHHGWPLSSDDWDAQVLFFLEKGYRVVAHDRRGHGRSSQVTEGA